MAGTDEFRYRDLPGLNKRVLRLGIAGNYGLTADDVEYAAERGANFWLWGRSFRKTTPALRRILSRDRESHVVSVLGNAFFKGGPRRDVERALRVLGTDYLDCYKLGWLGVASRLSPKIAHQLQALKEEGKVRGVGCSIHDRPRAATLVKDSVLDTFMLRYNAKHPGAEQDIFPHLHQRNPLVISYTATSWGQLLKKLKGAETPLTAQQCYRFCLSSPHVHVTLTGPRSRVQLAENLDALEQGPLDAEEMQRVRGYGAVVKGKKRLDYI